MARNWLTIQVELVGGGAAGDLWPAPGRDMIAGPGHSFADLAAAIDGAFARWDRAHLHTFDLADGRTLADQAFLDEDPGDPPALAGRAHRLGDLLAAGDVFTYTFDLGDRWRHRCTVTAMDVDPVAVLGMTPTTPLPFFGWGILPDQYGRLWLGDDGESDPPPPPPHLAIAVRQADRIIAIAEHHATIVLPGLSPGDVED
ncbi:hypothetical protein J2S43_000972 [Catenuloplanes nepalensis]|uniref:Plasmid pRiA4b Orf3-like domain-containing protein n=1 Tax=Catenuloplanes nepalensis TaxID=587533 RepID=A0ABT9MM31_9ACTN|nr:hypothetical protein [Catenuloplanes nepalensis]MDP9792460.1 hypothetical protein [Catenuloplanes nepalensis]